MTQIEDINMVERGGMPIGILQAFERLYIFYH